MAILILIMLLWTALGTVSFIFWWKKDFDLRVSDVLIGTVFGSILGPLAFIVGYFIHGIT